MLLQEGVERLDAGGIRRAQQDLREQLVGVERDGREQAIEVGGNSSWGEKTAPARTGPPLPANTSATLTAMTSFLIFNPAIRRG